MSQATMLGLGKWIYGLSELKKSAVKEAMAKKNGKWVVGAIFGLVLLMAFFSVQLKKDINRRSEAEKPAEKIP
ncbi:MAG TPA: hypothetical protein DCS60_07710 [Opitutae bacterium]|nr:hypothetical protein [Opitutae bacterium]|tara:strand:- start:552 stop:770 length:219 start_codon:yes stop_codon:yes gene_type:complete